MKKIILCLFIILALPCTAYAAEDRLVEIWEDGTVFTTYSDGSGKGVSPDGSILHLDTDGTKHQTEPDGTIMTKYPDGSYETRYPDGRYVWTDGKESYRMIDKMGLTTEIDPEGNSRVYFEGGEGELTAGENGTYKPGELTGPGGKQFIISENREMTFSSGDGIEFSYTEEAFSFSNATDEANVTISANGSVSVTVPGESFTRDEVGNIEIRNTDTGAFLRMENTGAMDFDDPESGSYMRVSADGEVDIHFIDDKTEIKFNNGNYEAKDLTTGYTERASNDGRVEFEVDDDIITIENGRVFVNDEEIEEDLPEGWQSGNTQPDNTDIQGDSGEPLSINNISGTYTFDEFSFEVYGKDGGIVIEKISFDVMSYDESIGFAISQFYGDEQRAQFSIANGIVQVYVEKDLYKSDGTYFGLQSYTAVKQN